MVRSFAVVAAITLIAGCDGGWLLDSGAEAGQPSVFDPCLTPADDETLIKQMTEAINAERAKHRLRPLKVNAALGKIADSYACRLVEKDFFDHIDPYDGSTVVSRANDNGYSFEKIGENLAAGQYSVEQAMKALLDSPRHRANILEPGYMEVGVSVRNGGRFGRYWVQEFGRQAPVDEVAKGPTEPVNAAEGVNEGDAKAQRVTGAGN